MEIERSVELPPPTDAGGCDDSADSDWRLLEVVASGDQRAFTQLVQNHQARLLRLCQRLLQDPEAAEDAVQEVLLKLYHNADRFESRGKLSTLLYRMATNYCLNQLRRRRIVRFLSLSRQENERGCDQLDPPDRAPDPVARLEARQRWRLTRRALERLPASQRTVLVLVKLEGLSYKQAAATLGISLGAVESRLFRAMRRLEHVLVEEGWVGSEGRR